MYHIEQSGNCLQHIRFFGKSHYCYATKAHNICALSHTLKEIHKTTGRIGAVYILFEMVNGVPWLYVGRTDEAKDRLTAKHHQLLKFTNPEIIIIASWDNTWVYNIAIRERLERFLFHKFKVAGINHLNKPTPSVAHADHVAVQAIDAYCEDIWKDLTQYGIFAFANVSQLHPKPSIVITPTIVNSKLQLNAPILAPPPQITSPIQNYPISTNGIIDWKHYIRKHEYIPPIESGRTIGSGLFKKVWRFKDFGLDAGLLIETVITHSNGKVIEKSQTATVLPGSIFKNKRKSDGTFRTTFANIDRRYDRDFFRSNSLNTHDIETDDFLVQHPYTFKSCQVAMCTLGLNHHSEKIRLTDPLNATKTYPQYFGLIDE